MGGSRGRVVVVSARVGAGHNGFTEELARRLRASDFVVDSLDFLDLLPGATGRKYLQLYNAALRRAPWVYAGLFEVGTWAGTAAITRRMLKPARASLLRHLGPD